MNTTPTSTEENVERRTLNAERRTFGARHFPLQRSAFNVRRSTFSPACTRAFTLVEMLLVLVILAVLAAIVIPKFAGRSQQAKESAAKADISNFSVALDAFEVDNGFYPQGSAGLTALVEQPNNLPSWKGPYLNKVPLDPWGNAYVYSYPGKANPKHFDLSSQGVDGQAGTGDDITNWDAKK